jgi:hypothetical protein
MKRKSSTAIKPQEGLESPTALVSITEVAPDPDQIEKWIKEDPVRLSGFVRTAVKHIARRLEDAPLIQKAKAGAESRKRTIAERLNEPKRQSAQQRKSIALELCARLIQQERTLRLPGKTSELARRIQTKWPKGEPPPETRTIRRWLAELRLRK